MLRCSIADCYLTDMAAYNVVLDEERNGRWAVGFSQRCETGYDRRPKVGNGPAVPASKRFLGNGDNLR